MKQGEIYWVDFGEPLGSEAAFTRPAVVIQNDRFNDSALPTVIVCPTTTRLRPFPGRVILKAGEAGLRADSMVETWMPMTIDRRALRDRLGELRTAQVRQVLEGMLLYIRPGWDDELT